MTLPIPAYAPATRSIEDLLKGSYWDKLGKDGDFMAAVHAYYAALKHPGKESFYLEARKDLIRESNRVTKA